MSTNGATLNFRNQGKRIHAEKNRMSLVAIPDRFICVVTATMANPCGRPSVT